MIETGIWWTVRHRSDKTFIFRSHMRNFSVQGKFIGKTVFKRRYNCVGTNRSGIKSFAGVIKMVTNVEVLISGCDLSFTLQWYPSLCLCDLERRNRNGKGTPDQG